MIYVCGNLITLCGNLSTRVITVLSIGSPLDGEESVRSQRLSHKGHLPNASKAQWKQRFQPTGTSTEIVTN